MVVFGEFEIAPRKSMKILPRYGYLAEIGSGDLLSTC
jgi:hypothetical protein